MSDEEKQIESQPEAVDTNIINVPNIPIPTIGKEDSVDDEFEGAIKFAIIGAGQGGSRIAETFWNLGYRRVCVINSSRQDAVTIKIPDDHKFLLSEAGAGKSMELADKLINERYEDVLDFLRRGFKRDYDRILICIGAGGGTGAGVLKAMVKIAHDLNTSLGVENVHSSGKVGVLIALPTNGEGRKVARNALVTMNYVFKKVEEKLISPLIVLDNQRIKDIYPNLTVSEFWGTANKSVCSLFHLFNTIACRESSYTSFDKTDFETILNSGAITFGATPLHKWKDATSISYAVRDNLKRNVLAGGMDIKKGNIAGCIIIGSPSVLAKVPQQNLEHGFEQLSRILGEGSTVHRGIYQGNKEDLVVYTVIGGLEKPEERIDELSAIVGNAINSLYDVE